MRKRTAPPDRVAEKSETISYGQAIEQLEAIIERIDEGDIGVDELAEAVKQAVGLVRVCRQRLRSTQEEVEQALKEMDAEPERPGVEATEEDRPLSVNGKPTLTLTQTTQKTLTEIDVFAEE